METGSKRTRTFIVAWTGFVLLVIYLPILCGALAGLSKSRYFNFPVRQYSFEWWQRTIDSIEIHWPSGITQIVGRPTIDRYHVIREKAETAR